MSPKKVIFMALTAPYFQNSALIGNRVYILNIFQAPDWQCVIVDLPSCQHLYSVNFSEVPIDYECQQIR